MTVRRISESWWVDFRYERERVRRKSPVNSRRGAEEYERTLRERLQRGEPVLGEKPEPEPVKEVPTVAAFLKEWLETYATTNNKPSEAWSKAMIVRRHLVPFFGKLRLNEVGIRELERFKAAQTKKGLAAKTVNNELTVLHRALRSAREWGYIASFPSVLWMKEVPPTFDFLTAEESERLLAAAPRETVAMIATALKTGLRRGELLALRWQDVDLVAQKIMVRQSVWKGRIGTPKSGKHREVPISPRLLVYLRAHRHLRGPLVFCQEDGGLSSKDMVKNILPVACKRAGLREVQWHVLRHSFASQLVMAGVPLRAVQELLGHATIEMTMRYSHLAPSMLVEAVAVLDVLCESPGHQMGIDRRAVGAGSTIGLKT